MSTKCYPKNVYFWQNGMAMVFDQFGHQMPELQGKREEVEAKIRAASTSETIFNDNASWRNGIESGQLEKDYAALNRYLEIVREQSVAVSGKPAYPVVAWDRLKSLLLRAIKEVTVNGRELP